MSSQQFHQFYVGLLQPTNCAYYIQQVEGNISDPKIKLAAAGFNVVGGAVKSLLSNIGSAVDLGGDLVKGTTKAVGDVASYVPVVGKATDKTLNKVGDQTKNVTGRAVECEPFYYGSVRHPKADAPLSRREIRREKRKEKLKENEETNVSRKK